MTFYTHSMSTVDHERHVWARTDHGEVRCAHQSCPARPSPAELARLEDEIATAAPLRTTIVMRGR